MSNEVCRAVVCATGRAVLPRFPERRWFFHRQKHIKGSDVRWAPAKHVRLVTVPA